jgi:hypothetical protein
MNENVLKAVESLSDATGVSLRVSDGELSVAGNRVALPADGLRGERAELLGIAGLFPTVAHGDSRDTLIWPILGAAGPKSAAAPLRDRDLLGRLPGSLGLGVEASRVAALALEDRFYARRRDSRRARRDEPAETGLMLPVHSALPLNYQQTRRLSSGKLQPVGYTMFDEKILPYLLWDADLGHPNTLLIQQFLDAMSGEEQLTVLDRRFMQIALDGAPRPAQVPIADDLASPALIQHLAAEFTRSGGPFCEASLALFERDLRTVLSASELPRPERVRWLTLALSLHLALRFYRAAAGLGGSLDLAVAAAARMQAPADAAGCGCTGRDIQQLKDCALAGRIKFRVGSSQYVPVRQTDPCRAAYVQLDRGRLMDLPVTLVTRNLACRAWEALGGGDPASRRDLAALARALEGDDELRRVHGAACAAIAILHHDAWKSSKATLDELVATSSIGPSRPGLHALRDDVRRMRRNDLRHQGADVVNQLVLAPSVGDGSMIGRNGPNFTFFEVDEELLLLLVRLICREGAVPVDEFLTGLRLYGLEPQHEDERERLANTLERLGLLERYSDAGEASFVRYA